MILFVPLMIGTTELILIAALALLLFGGKKLPELMRGLGRGVKNFRDGMNEPSVSDSEGKVPAAGGENSASDTAAQTANPAAEGNAQAAEGGRPAQPAASREQGHD